MELRQLRYFLAVAEHSHFTRAAEAAFVSQPALSQQIKALERELGAPLFDRLTTGARLTAAGRVLRPHAERILREMENSRVAVEEVTGRIRGELALSAVHTANLTLVVEVLASFRERHPGVAVRIYEERSQDVVESVVSGRVNIGITYLPVAGEALAARPLYSEELVLVLPERHALADQRLELRDLEDVPLIVPPEGFCLRQGIDRVFREAGHAADIVAEISSMESICEAVRAGLGATLLPRAYMDRQTRIDGLKVIRLGDEMPARQVGVIRHADRHLCLATRAFMSALDARAEGMDGSGCTPPRAVSAGA